VPPVDQESPASNGPDDMVAIDGRFYRRIQAASVSYNLSNHASTPVLSSLVDSGANGGMAAGDDVRTLSESSSFSKDNATGIGEGQIQNVALATVTGHISTHCGPDIVILNQYANYGKGYTTQGSWGDIVSSWWRFLPLNFKRRFGHWLLPHNLAENIPLAQWVKRQRYQYKL
jgi:hypothetical protein